MKTKIFTVTLSLMVNIISFAQADTLTLDFNTPNEVHYYCDNTDSVIVILPEGTLYWIWNDIDYTSEYLIIKLASNPMQKVEYQAENGEWHTHKFWIYFVSIAPTEVWQEEAIYKCPDIGIELIAQAGHQNDFIYLWNTGETSRIISIEDDGSYAVTITGACGVIEDEVTVIDHPSPQVNLGEDMLGLCNWDHPTLSPGEFNSYLWSDGSTESTLTITEYGVYAITVTDENSCVASDEIEISFYVNPGLEITVVTMDTVTGNNMVTWNTNIPDFQGENVKVYRNGSTNQLTEIGTASYDDGYFIDQVNSTNRTWRYAISVQDECENWSGVSLWHQSMKVSLLEAVGSGIQVSWTQYEVEGNTKDFSIASYEIYSVPGFGINWALNEVASIPGTETTYDIPASLDSLFVVGAVFASNAKSDEESVVSLSFNDNPVINTGVEMLSLSNLSIYPNPSHTGTIVVDAIGELEIYNSLGQKILAKKLKGPDQISLNSGIYMVKFLDQNNATTTKKVIIY